MDGLGLLVVGLLALVPATLVYSGLWGSWAGRGSPGMVLTIVPGFGLAMSLCGAGLLLGGPVGGTLVGVGTVVLLAAFVLMIWTPSWVGPRWYREARRQWPYEQLPEAMVPPRAERTRRPWGAAEAPSAPGTGPSTGSPLDGLGPWDGPR